MAEQSISDDTPVKQIPKAEAAKQVAAAQAAAVQPAKAAEVEHPKPEEPKSEGFNSMAAKLDALLKGDAPVEDKPVEKVEAKVESQPDAKADAKADEVFTSKKSADWKSLKAELKAEKDRAEQLTKDIELRSAELEVFKKQPVIDPKEIETIRTEKQKLQDQLDVVALERSPRFEAHYSKLFSDATALAKEAAPTEMADQIEHLLQLPSSKARKEQLSTILTELPNEVDKINLAGAFRQMDLARAERTEQLSKAKEKLAQIRAHDEAEAGKQNEKNRQRAEAKIGAVLKIANNLEAFKPIDGNEEHNLAIKDREAKVRRALMGELPENESAMLPLLAEEGVHLRTNVIPVLFAKIKQQQVEIDQLTSASPNGKAHGQPDAGTNQPKTFSQSFIENWTGPVRKR